jgi:Putative TM nitroreductase
MSGHGPGEATITAGARRPLSANERAVIDRIPIPALREPFERLWRLKIRLQFTGWLQYVPPALILLALLAIAGLAQLLGIGPVAVIFAVGGAVLLALEVFDLITVKFRIRPPEPRPRRLDDLGAFDLLRARRSCRSFQTRKLMPADRDELLEAVRRHLSDGRIGTGAIRLEFVSEKLTVWPTVNASEFLVAIAPVEYDKLAVIDVGRTLERVVADATRMGLGTCWIGPGADQRSIQQHLGYRFDPARDHIICVCAVGYRSWFVPLFIRVFNARFSQRRKSLDQLFFTDPGLRAALDVEAPPFDRFGRTFEVCQWAPSSYNGQTTRGVAVTDGSRLARVDFYQSMESRYYGPVAAGIFCAHWEMGCEALGIAGHVGVLPAARRDDEQPAPGLIYDVSWVPDTRAPAEAGAAQ